MPWEKVKIHAPPFRGEAGMWLNVERPPTLEELTGEGILLVDFWEYSCVNCLRALPYLIEWHERYAPLGLTIVGIHTPEFAFGRERALVSAAVERLGIPYPVLMDEAQQNWQAFANRAWPSKYLIDRHGIIRYRAVGEGRYEESEAAIQALLRELHPGGLELPPLLEAIRPTDVTGAICYRPTPELHAGHALGRLGNPEPFGTLVPRHFQPVAEREEGWLYFEGPWRAEQEFSESAGERALLHLPYRAAEVNAVLGTADGAPQRLYLLHDGQPLTLGEAGEDVVVDSEFGSYVTVGAPRMYNLAINPDFARHEITLEALAPGLRVFAFSFVSCTKAEWAEGDIVVP